MSRLQKVFQQQQHPILNIYCTAGFPQQNDTLTIMQALQESGVDIIELGMPYSDPLADGPVIQQSSNIAIQNGMTLALLFKQLATMRLTIHVPVILMGYANPVMQFGFEQFCAQAKAVGIDGLIIPDIPMYEFETTYKAIVEKYELDFIFLVTPETSEARVRQIDGVSSGFIYAVSSSSVTGSTQDTSGVTTYLQRLQSYQLKNPILVGFGISDSTSFKRVSQYTQGGIIGTAFIKALLQQPTDVALTTKNFVHSILS
ncbi:MAG TPA: tryptophan synthase subunit alpha [Chitinophagaceae bacterium]|nr:tryptophan synthase subunit alpha [Chitinophagaceae bacterium]